MVHKRASPAGGAFLHPDQWKKEDENQQSSITVRMTTVAESTISALLAQWDEYGLYELTEYYRDRLEQAIEEGVKTLRCMSGQEGHFRAEEHEKVTELKGNRIESFRLFISLVMGKDSQTRRVMWESIVKMRSELQKFDKILKDIQVLGPDPQEYMNIAQGISELPTQLIGPGSAITELLASWSDFQLLQLTDFYRDRLEQAMEGGVHRVSLALTAENQFSGEEHRKISDLADKGERADSSKLLLSLVMEKGSRAPRVMWETFVKLRIGVPKLDKILKEIEKHGCVPVHRPVPEIPRELKDVQQKHKETLRAQTETLRVNTILMREKVKVFQLVDRYAELTVISTVRDRRLVEHELLARGRCHEEWREKHLRGELEKIQTDQLFQSSFSRSKSKSGSSAAVAGVAGIGKTTMVQKIVYDWATGKIYQQFQFVFSFKFRDLNTINCRINLKELILDQYPYFGNILREVWKNPEGLLFIFDGLDEFKDKIDFSDTTCQVIDWVKGEVKRQSGNTWSEAGKRSLLNTLHYLFESQNRGLAQAALESVETLSFSGMTLTPVDCAVLSHVIGLCDTIKHLNLGNCHIQFEGIQRLGPGLHKCQELGLGWNQLGDSGVKLVSAALRNPESKIQKLDLYNVGLRDSGAEDLVSALSTNPSLTVLNLGSNSLTDGSVPASPPPHTDPPEGITWENIFLQMELVTAPTQRIVFGHVKPFIPNKDLLPTLARFGQAGDLEVTCREGPGEGGAGAVWRKKAKEKSKHPKKSAPERAELTPICPEVEQEAPGSAQLDGVMEAESNAPSVNPAPVCSSGLKRRRECFPKRAGNEEAGEPQEAGDSLDFERDPLGLRPARLPVSPRELVRLLLYVPYVLPFIHPLNDLGEHQTHSGHRDKWAITEVERFWMIASPRYGTAQLPREVIQMTSVLGTLANETAVTLQHTEDALTRRRQSWRPPGWSPCKIDKPRITYWRLMVVPVQSLFCLTNIYVMYCDRGFLGNIEK
ncbi:uncharacterized protein [Hemitrygon akajei]|uniref:uncharacterized protein n=1 Tax=Hemitrygon akajei TaxID=2704970 RepID=UPI003BF98724